MCSKIIIHPELESVSASAISQRLQDVEIYKPRDLTPILKKINNNKILIISNQTWDDKYIHGLKQGDWVTTIGVGYDAISTQALSEAGIIFTNSSGVNTAQVAEHVFATALSFTRNLWMYRDQQRKNVWQKQRGEMTDFYHDKCCVLGLGSIGEAVAERASAFGMFVHGIKRTTNNYNGSADVVHSPENLGDGLQDARLLVIAVPLTTETKGVIGLKEFKALANDAIVVNVARGSVVESESLIPALDNNEIHAICLDVTDPEPLPEGHPLWDREDVLITPHSAGLSKKYPDRFLDLFAHQYKRWCSGEELRYQVR